MFQVIGAGLGRTGTHSLGIALDKLGFGPSYTLFDVDRNPDHLQTWERALEGQSVDWEKLFQNYRSAVEWPSVFFLPQLVDHFPKAKVILTVREPESWYESASKTIFPALEATAQHPDLRIRDRSIFKRQLILEKQFSGKYWDKTHTLDVFRKHIQSVEALVPADRMLSFDVKDGWPPLCQFLNVKQPDEPFPQQNKRSDFLSSAPQWAVEVIEANRKEREHLDSE